MCVCVCVINSLSFINSLSRMSEKRKGKSKKNRQKMPKTENQLSVGENIIEAFFVFEKLEALLAASTETLFGKEESRCLT